MCCISSLTDSTGVSAWRRRGGRGRRLRVARRGDRGERDREGGGPCPHGPDLTAWFSRASLDISLKLASDSVHLPVCGFQAILAAMRTLSWHGRLLLALFALGAAAVQQERTGSGAIGRAPLKAAATIKDLMLSIVDPAADQSGAVTTVQTARGPVETRPRNDRGMDEGATRSHHAAEAATCS